MKTAANGLTDSPWLTDEELCRSKLRLRSEVTRSAAIASVPIRIFAHLKRTGDLVSKLMCCFLRRTQPNLSAVNAAAGTTLFPDNAVDVVTGRACDELGRVDCHNWEMIYFGTDSWNALRNPAATAGAHLPDEFTSQLVSWEFNWDKPIRVANGGRGLPAFDICNFRNECIGIKR